MIKWQDILSFAKNGNPIAFQKVEKTEDEWKKILSPEQFRITRLKGTERPHSSEMCHAFGQGVYECICCHSELFEANEKFDSGTGWPSFTQPIKPNSIGYVADYSHGMTRIETICNTCDAHLGHVFPDGPQPSGVRFCINAVALKKKESDLRKIVLGGGCFWCTEAIFQKVKGVVSVKSGYAGGQTINPAYRQICTGQTGHAEVVEIQYDANIVSLNSLIKIHMTTHNPTTLNRQGADKGTQYRSIVFYNNEDEKSLIQDEISQLQKLFSEKIVTQVEKSVEFYEAEDYHQNYYRSNPSKAYCMVVIEPKIAKFRKMYFDKFMV